MIRSGTERRLRRRGGGKRWDQILLGWASIIQKDLSSVFMRAYTAPFYSRRGMKRMAVKNRVQEGGVLTLLPMLYKFSPAEPREQSVPRSMIRETSAEADGARAGTTVSDERKGLERPSSAAGD